MRSTFLAMLLALVTAFTTACGGGAEVTSGAGGNTAASSGGGGAGGSAGSGGGGSGGQPPTPVLQSGYHWGPENAPLVLTTTVEVRKIDGGVTLQVCSGGTKFAGEVDFQLWWYDTTTKERGIALEWNDVSVVENCTEPLDAGTGLPIEEWLQPRLIVPSGVIGADNCPNEEVCMGAMPPEDNTYRATSFRMLPDMPGSNEANVQTGCFWGPEVGSPVLTTETQNDGLEFRVCKCEGQFGGVLDVDLWSYDLKTQKRGSFMNWPAVDAVDSVCTNWFTLDSLPLDQWLEPRLASPTGTTANNCPNEQVCVDAMNTAADGVYLSTSFGLITPTPPSN